MSYQPDRQFMYWGVSPDALDFAIPYPSVGHAAFETQRGVDSARNTSWEVVATQLGRPSDKQNMEWTVLDPEIWWDMNRWLEANGMFFWCRYFSFNTGEWRVRRFYCGDVSAEPFMLNIRTGLPKYMLNCKLNVIDCGIVGEG